MRLAGTAVYKGMCNQQNGCIAHSRFLLLAMHIQNDPDLNH